MTKKLTCFAFVATLGLSASVTPVSAVEFQTPKAIIELFTSQGCSSCPPADAALKEMNAKGDYLGLALHVDYWDRLGWKDTFASADNTKRQWRYARALGERQVYTPQAIINGRTHLVGSRKSEIKDIAKAYASSKDGLTIPVNLENMGETISVSIPANSDSSKATLYAFYFNPTAEVEIKRGENAGRKINYSNIVGKVEMIGMVGADGMKTEFSIADMKRKGYAGCALLLQTRTSQGSPGPIIGASVITDL